MDASRDLLQGQGNSARNTATHTHVVTFSHAQGYRRGDDFSVSVELENVVTQLTLVYNHSIYEEIINMEFYTRWEDTSGETPGFGHVNSVFRQAEPVLFRATFERGSHLTFSWDFGDGVTESIYDNPNTSHIYAEPGVYTIRLVVSNFMDSASYTQIIRIQREVSSAISIYTVTPIVANSTYDFNISLANMTTGDWGTAPCYKLDWDGDENTTTHMTFFGNLTQCQESYPDEYTSTDPSYVIEYSDMTDSYLENLFDGNTWLNVTKENYYGSVTQYIVKLTGKNIVSEVTTTFRFVTTAGPCYNPRVELEPVNRCTPGFNCHATLNIPTFLRSANILLNSRVIFDCFTSQVSL